MVKFAIGSIVVLALAGFGYDSAVHIQKNLNDYVARYASGGNVCVCDNVYNLGAVK